ncbi:MAG: polyprenyl synthetase family protein [Acidobacteria bacterium]|nr:polyprenyl synthetase family protein [Acidobacteriota bacterium]
MSRAEIAALVAADLAKVERAIELDTVCSVEAVTAISQHLQLSGGKRLRPMLVLLTARACGYKGDGAVRLGAVTEIVHAATLVHDDVIDEAKVRRGRPSSNQRWGNHTSVLAGDWLYMQAFNLTLRERNFKMLDLLIELTQTMVEGELLQAEMAGRADLSEDDHLGLIHRKTASLFSVCARYGALLAGVDEQTEARMGDYGWNLGIAFQLIDDVLDLSATEKVLGKPVGNDLREGKATLPVILALAECSPEEREKIETVMRDGDYQRVPHFEVQGILERYGTLEAVRRRALAYTDIAAEQLAPLPDTPYKRALTSILDLVVERDN